VRMRRREDKQGKWFFDAAHKDVEFLIVIGEKEWEEAFNEYAKRGNKNKLWKKWKTMCFWKSWVKERK
jgi:hypothetical protein